MVKSKAYPGLDLVRLAAALLVAVYHLGYHSPARKLPEFSPGWVGVEIFFVLSGFVIAFSAEGRTIGGFVRSRVARLYPAALICSTIIALLIPVSWSTYVRSITLFPIGPWVDGVYWTLPVEMAFYSVVAIALWRTWSLENVAVCLLCYSSAFWFLRAINLVHPFAPFQIVESNPGYILLLHFGVFFALGMLLYAHAWRRATFAVPVAAFATGWMAHGVGAPSVGYQLAAVVIWLAALGGMVFFIQWNEQVSRVLDKWPTRTLGLMTYPLYLLHTAVGLTAMRLIADPDWAFLVGLAVSLAAAFAVIPLESFVRRMLRVQRIRGPASLP